MTLLETIRANIRRALDERTATQTQIDDVLAAVETEGRSDLTPEETATFTTLRSDLGAIDANVTAMRARESELVEMGEARAAAATIASSLPVQSSPTPETTSVQVRSEPLTYQRGASHSYFRDLARAYVPGGDVDLRAAERIRRHANEMDVEQRANMTRTDGVGGEFVPPLWLMNETITVARAGRVTAELCRMLPLPAGTDSINLPRVATGSTAAEQADLGVVSNVAMTTNSVNAPVTTFAGQQVFAMQLLDQSPVNMDEIVFQDLMADLAVRVDTYVLTKAAIGILNVTGAVAVTFTNTPPATVPLLFPKIADGIQQIQTTRFLSPQAIVMHPRRWAWHLAALDSSNRPLVVPNDQGPTNAFAGFGNVRAEGAVGSMQGLPVYVDPNIPTNLGGGTEDRIITARFDDLYLFEGDVRTRVLFETDADTLQVRLQVWEYGAFLGSRYPKSIAITSGVGMVPPVF